MFEIPLSLYIHMPWCIRKCPYCDFNSHPLRGEIPEQAYISRLITDLEQDLPRVWGREIQTIFIGGGTPSLFSGKAMTSLLSQLRARLPFAADIEISLEANPGTIDEQYFQAYRDAGINRLSLGVQSLDDDQLKKLGRIHNVAQVSQAITTAKQAGFNNINLDIMFALPNQQVAQAMLDIERALHFEPTHFSWYQLTLEPNTAFYHQPPALPTDEQSWVIQQTGQEQLQHHGFQQYEISAFARENQVCRHNVNYWRFGDYLGIGAGAHSKITDQTTMAITRLAKQRHPNTYLNSAKSIIASEAIITPAQLPFEYMLNRLRLFTPLDLNDYQVYTGLDGAGLQPTLDKALAKELITQTKQHISLTPLGWRFYNDVIELFLP